MTPEAFRDAGPGVAGPSVESGAVGQTEICAAGQAESALLEDAAVSLAQAHALLANGSLQNCVDCLPHCQRAGSSLQSWCASVERTPPALRVGPGWTLARQKVRELSRQTYEASMLHQHAAGFYLGWIRLLGGLSGARYSPDGLSLELAPGQRVSVEG
jgi:hypothetical protein